MTHGGRCYGARAGRLEESLVYARRAYEAGAALDDMRLRALRSMEAEPHMYKGDWDAVVRVAEQALPGGLGDSRMERGSLFIGLVDHCLPEAQETR